MTSEQINLLTAVTKDVNEIMEFPFGMSAWYSLGSIGPNNDIGMVVTNRSKSSNASQTLITSGGGIYIRARISNEWTPWQQQETTTGAQAKVDAHANKKDNPHGFTAAQLGLPNASTQNDYMRLGGNTGSSALGPVQLLLEKMLREIQILMVRDALS